MNIYKVIFKDERGQSHWDNKPLLIVASNFANAEDKALNFSGKEKSELISITLYGETTIKNDVYQLRERHA